MGHIYTAGEKVQDEQEGEDRRTEATNRTNAQIAKATNLANLEIADLTNASNERIANQNLGFQRENLDYQKQLQQQIFNREDTSYQRTVADMRNAGISPLAMQGTNGAGEAISTEALNNSMVAQGYQAQGWQAQKAQTLRSAMTDAEVLRGILDITTSISNLQKNSEETRSLSIQNDYAQSSFDSRLAQQKAQTILSHYSVLDAREKRYYNNLYGITESMPEDQKLAHIASYELLSDEEKEKRKTGKALREFEDRLDLKNFDKYGTFDSGLIKAAVKDVTKNVADVVSVPSNAVGKFNEKVLPKVVEPRATKNQEADDKKLRSIAEKQKRGERLSLSDKAFLFLTNRETRQKYGIEWEHPIDDRKKK